MDSKGRDKERGPGSSSFGGWQGPMWQMTSSVLTRKFQTDWLRLHFGGRLKLQLGQFGDVGLAQVTDCI